MFNVLLMALGGLILSKDNPNKAQEVIGSVLLSVGMTQALRSTESKEK